MKTDTDGLTMNQLAERNAGHVATIAALEARCAALAAEGAKLKNPDNWLSQSDYGYEAAEVATQNGATEPMTTITKEFTKEQLIAKAQEQIAFCRDTKITGEGRTHVNQCSALFEIALASLDAKPIGAFHIADQQVEGTSDYIKDGEWPIDNGIIEVYAASPAQEAGVYKDMLNIVDLLENNEWAEHCTSTLLGSHLESEITRLIGKEQPVSVVPEEMPKGLAGQIVSLLAHNIGDKFLAQKIWNACRNAMLNGDTFRENSISSTNNVREIAETSTNSPVIPDGYALVPVEPTEEMIAAAMECEDVLFNSDGSFCVQFREIYCAMVDVAPKPETGLCTK